MVCDTGMVLSGIRLGTLKCGETSIAVARFYEIGAIIVAVICSKVNCLRFKLDKAFRLSSV